MNKITNISFAFSLLLTMMSSDVMSSSKHSHPDRPEENIEAVNVTAGHNSYKSMPLEYQPPIEKLKKLPRLDLDKINAHAGVSLERLNSWESDKLRQGNFMLIQGINFLDFSSSGFMESFTDYFKLNGDVFNDKAFYFLGLWKCLWLSCSLVHPTKFPACGNYGIVLEIPPQLILKTYQLDSTTPVNSELMHKVKNGEDLNRYVGDYLACPGCFNSVMEMDESGMPTSRRVFAEGESEDSNAFMTPEEMIKRGRLLEHNEIKFVPKGKYQGKKYNVRIVGLWYTDIPRGTGMCSIPATSEDILVKLRLVAADLSIDLLPLSQRKATPESE